MSETYSSHKKLNKIASDIKLVFLSSNITMMHGPVSISFHPVSDILRQTALATSRYVCCGFRSDNVHTVKLRKVSCIATNLCKAIHDGGCFQ